MDVKAGAQYHLSIAWCVFQVEFFALKDGDDPAVLNKEMNDLLSKKRIVRS